MQSRAFEGPVWVWPCYGVQELNYVTEFLSLYKGETSWDVEDLGHVQGYTELKSDPMSKTRKPTCLLSFIVLQF